MSWIRRILFMRLRSDQAGTRVQRPGASKVTVFFRVRRRCCRLPNAVVFNAPAFTSISMTVDPNWIGATRMACVLQVGNSPIRPSAVRVAVGAIRIVSGTEQPDTPACRTGERRVAALHPWEPLCFSGGAWSNAWAGYAPAARIVSVFEACLEGCNGG